MKTCGNRSGFALALFALSCGGLIDPSPDGEDSTSSGSRGAVDLDVGTGGRSAGDDEVSTYPPNGHPAVGHWSVVGRETEFDFGSPVEIESVTEHEIVGRVNGAPDNGVREGSASGLELSFFLQDGSAAWWFDLATSEAGGRMTGSMAAISGVPPFPNDVDPTARVTFLKLDLERYQKWKIASGSYDRFIGYGLFGKSFEVSLTSATPSEGEFSSDQRYRVFFEREWMGGDFGAFHGMEMTIPSTVGAPIKVGPVTPTKNSSIVEMELFFGNENPLVLSGLIVRTASASVY